MRKINTKPFLNKIKKFLRFVYNAPIHASLLRNAYRGLPNSQCELAEFYFSEIENFIEAYAWAEVARYHGHRNSYIKAEAEKMLTPEQLKIAINLARDYKTHLCR